MPLVRFEVRNEYGLGDPELYRAASKREDPRALLDGVAVAGLVGILRQLGDLAEFAADVFHDLHEQVMATSARGHKMLTRIRHIEAALPSVEKAIQGQRSHIHFAYVAGSDWHANLRTDQSHLVSSDLPRFMMDSYEECRDPPRLYLLDKFDNAGTGACLKRYSDPSYFKRVWATSELEKAEIVQREKKAQKIKRKGSRLGSVEFQDATSLSRRYSSTRFASPSTDEQSFTTENTSISDVRLKPELANGYSSFCSKTRLNYADQAPDTNSSVVPDELEYDRLSVSKLQINQSGACAYDLHDETIGIGPDDDSQHNSLQEQSVHRSPSVTWDEKTEIQKPASSRSCDDILVDQVQNSEPLPMSSQPLNIDHEAAKFGTVDQGKIMFDIANAPVPLSSGNHFEEVTSETDNYVDALNTLESETETDSECQTKRELNSLTSSSYEEMEYGTAKKPEIVVPHPDISDMQSESLENEQSPHASGFASSLDYHEGNGISENNVLGVPRMNISKGVTGDQSLESITRNSQAMLVDETTANTPKSQDLPPVDTYGVPSTKFWTNGSLFGVEPSKPPVFSVPDVASEDITSGSINAGADCSREMRTTPLHYGGLAATSETMVLLSESISKNSNFVEKLDDTPNASISLDKSSKNGDKFFGRSDNAVQQSEHDDMPAKQNSQEDFQANSSIVSGRMQNMLSTDMNDQNEPDMSETYSVTPGYELLDNDYLKSQANEIGQDAKGTSSSFAGLAQRFLGNSIQRKLSANPSDISTPSEVMNADLSKPQETPLPHKHKEAPNGGVPRTSYEPNIKERIEHEISKKLILSYPCCPGNSSPPVEHMKISFHPMNGLGSSKLKLEFPNGSAHEGIEDLMFPSFQLLPGPIHPFPDSGPESDDDTFCRSCPYSSDDHLSPRSDSNSEFWGHDDQSGSYNHEISDDLRRLSSSTASVSSFKGFEQMNQIDPESRFENLEAEHGMLYFRSGSVADLPGLDSFIFLNNQQQGMCDSLSPDLEDSALQSQNELPPPPPLPPMQWRMIKPSFARAENKDASVSEIVPEDQRSNAHGQQEQSTPRAPHITETIVDSSNKIQDQKQLNGHIGPNHNVNGNQMDKREELLYQIRNKHDQKKLNGHKEPTTHGANSKELDEKVVLLDQIRNKSLNLRRTTAAKPSLMPQLATNVNVAAILEKANAIRQAFVGSDDGGDDDNWSDG